MFLIPRATISNLADYEYVYPDEETEVAYSNNEITTQQVRKTVHATSTDSEHAAGCRCRFGGPYYQPKEGLKEEVGKCKWTNSLSFYS